MSGGLSPGFFEQLEGGSGAAVFDLLFLFKVLPSRVRLPRTPITIRIKADGTPPERGEGARRIHLLAVSAYPLSGEGPGVSPRCEIPEKILRLRAARLITTPSTSFAPGASAAWTPGMKMGMGRQNRWT